ncbi:response regulator [Sporosarcina sp. Marseille-Q4063]|uniref:ATP-binding protein n=1 Tax=Sporosarcina sp. Marseille-Q4063 TaxID=2810514 RepID=UPI001BB046C3|nr:ATP-binding protein [Sporosarcina sp. Marseille-Q4063]QUW21051.1 response regulator [Sporosarcina sp. Marseille-Q4063]
MIIKGIKNSVILFLILIFFTFSHHAHSSNEDAGLITITSASKEIKVYEKMMILQDKEKTLTIDDVTKEENLRRFTQTKKGIPNFGYIDSVYWTVFTLENTSDIEDWYLEISYPPLERVTSFSETTIGDFEEIKLGQTYPFQHRKVSHRNHVFDLKIQPGDSKRIFLRVETGGSMQLPIILWEKEEFIKKTQMEFIYLGIFYGALIAMTLYNLFLYFSLHHRSYLYYVLVISGSIFSNAAMNGLGFQYIWPDLPWFNHRSAIVFIHFGIIACILFTESFLDTNRYFPRFKKIGQLIMALNALNLFIVFFISYKVALNIIIPLMLISIFTIITVGFICLQKGARQARFFLIAWIIFILGIAISALADGAYIPLNFWSKYAVQISATLEVILLSLALADRINILRLEKESAELQARKSQAEAVESLKRADAIKDEFLAITSHELRTPLYGIIGIAESLRDGVEGEITNSMDRQLSMISSSGKRLTNLVNDILDFSKLKHNAIEVNMQQVKLYEIINIVLAICNPLVAGKPINITNKIQKSIPSVRADQDRLIQILYNLIGNAIKYTDHGDISVSAERLENQLKISIADTGKGIPESDLESIFNSFHQVDDTDLREVGGTGIGLSITKKLVELLDGKIEVISTFGVGSTFSFTLPIYEESVMEDEVASSVAADGFIDTFVPSAPIEKLPTHSNKGTSAKILIADDEPVNLQVLINNLSLEGYKVVAASNGEEVLSIVENEDFDLLILDVMMPKLSGFEVTKELRTRHSLTELPILMLTAKTQLYDRVMAFEMGANDYLAKPCDKEELIARVETLINLSKLNKELTEINRSLGEIVKERTSALEETNTNLLSVNEELKNMEESRTLLLSSISHELATPITLIQNYIQAVQEGLIQENNPRYLEMVQQKLNMLNRLTKDLFELSKLKSAHISINFKEISFNKWFEQLTDGLSFDLQRSGRKFISANLSGSRAVITGDVERLSQAFSNVIWNAVKHTLPTTGEINLTAEIVKDTKTDWDWKVRIHISDNGFGIPKESLPFIFERFYQGADNSMKTGANGTGLGLAITKEIIILHNGTIEVVSEMGEGTTFTIELPLRTRNGGMEGSIWRGNEF